MRFIILADDFTGAMDTGIQFAQRGIPTGYYGEIFAFQKALSHSGREVFIVNTNSRHLSAQEAYETVYKYARIAIEAGVDGIMKKTDSGLRGNVGSELAALKQAGGDSRLSFIPAYPKMNRVTRDGYHYIEGVPVHESVFGKDPFEPVTTSCVQNLFSQSKERTYSMNLGSYQKGQMPKGIIIWDAASKEDIRNIVMHVSDEMQDEEKTILWAGCAGLGDVLAEQLSFGHREPETLTWPSGLLVACGSVNAVSKEQVLFAVQHGFYRESLEAEEIFREDYVGSQQFGKRLERIQQRCSQGIPCMIDTGFPDREEIIRRSSAEQLSPGEAGERTADTLGGILCRITRQRMPVVLMVIGGDTLQGYMEQLGFQELRLLRELAPGVVLCMVIWEGTEQFLITKSGGFGDRELLVNIRETLKCGKPGRTE